MSFTEGDFQEIPLRWSLGRKYGHHPIHAFEDIRPLKIFSHVSDLSMAQSIVRAAKYSWYPGYCFSWSKMPARVSLGYAAEEIAKNDGALCRLCGPVALLEPTAHELLHGQWSTLQLCDECLKKAKKTKATAKAKEMLQRKRYMEIRRDQEEARAAQDEARRAKRLARAAERELQKLERVAAYELVKKLGLLEAR